MLLKITPLDTVFFRNARPFSMGEDTWADSLFPPNPSVLYGALRTVFIHQHSDFNKSAENLAQDTKDIKIKSIFLQNGSTNLFPLPLDLVQPKGAKPDDPNVNVLSVRKRTTVSGGTSDELSHILVLNDHEQIKEVEGGYISMQDLNDYLSGKKKVQYQTEFKHLKEPKIGIKLNHHTRSTNGDAAGSLYRVEMTRLPHNTAIVLDCDGLASVSEQVSRLGGEGKVAAFQPLNEEFKIPVPPVIERYFKLYLMTPAFFKKGWLPEWIEDDMTGSPAVGLRLKLLTAATGRPVSIGGWDMKANRPKIMLKAVPVGAVYYFEILEGTPEMVLQKFHYKSVAEDILTSDEKTFEPAKEGFGVALVGKFEKQD